MARKCAVCGGKMSLWAPEYSLSNKHPDTYVCNSCDDLLRIARKGEKDSLAQLKNKVASDATGKVKEYIESLSEIKEQTHSKDEVSTNQIVEVTEDELIGISIKDAISKVKMCDGEKLIKTYHCCTMSYPWSEGYLLVTNKRIIYCGLGKKSCFINEASIDSVSGINTMYGKRVNLTKLLFGILLAILGVIVIFYNNQYMRNVIKAIFNATSLILLTTSFILIITSIKKCFKLAIYSSKALGIPINVTTDKGDSNNIMFSLSAKPTKETDKMMFELGALIYDIQTMEDIAIDKWRG